MCLEFSSEFFICMRITEEDFNCHERNPRLFLLVNLSCVSLGFIITQFHMWQQAVLETPEHVLIHLAHFNAVVLQRGQASLPEIATMTVEVRR